MKIALFAIIAVLATSSGATETNPNEYLPVCAAAYTVTSIVHQKRNSREDAEGYAKLAIAFKKASDAELGMAKSSELFKRAYTGLNYGITNNEPGAGQTVGNLATKACPPVGSFFKVARFL